MASPQSIMFFVRDPATGLGKTGLTCTFDSYVADDGTDLTPPAITEVGHGWYKFTPDFTIHPSHEIGYVVNTAGYSPDRVPGFLRPEDFNGDLIPALQTTLANIQQFQQGNWEIPTTGPDAGRLIVYSPDGVTPLIKFDLKLPAGGSFIPTNTSNTKRIKV